MVTMRALARALGVSATSVSGALSGRGGVSAATALRIKQTASRLGYKRNPLASSILAGMRHSRSRRFGEIAAVSFSSADAPSTDVFHRELFSSARRRAEELGFNLTNLAIGDPNFPVKRLDTVLRTRGIEGLLLFPSRRQPDLSRLDWTRLSAVRVENSLSGPPLHCVCCDSLDLVIQALSRVAERGYRRPGLVIEREHDEEAQFRWSAAFQAICAREFAGDPIDPLCARDLCPEIFASWFAKNSPDVVLSHRPETMEWMESLGVRFPRTHGFVSLNTAHSARACAGLDHLPAQLGARATELLIGQLQFKDHGVSMEHMLTTIRGLWKDGPTVRRLA